jgi:glycosyltransferase involved in cell wall biosynthesis
MNAPKAHPLKILIVSQYSFPPDKRNMNMYQRVLHGSRFATIFLLVRRGSKISPEIENAVSLHRAPVRNRVLFVLYAGLFSLFLRFRGCRTVLTEPSGISAAGFLASKLAGYLWALDVWDRPRWRAGEHEQDKPARLSDRIVFQIMRRADLYLLSVLPRAAKDIVQEPSRCVQLYNAIDQSLVAPSALARPDARGRTLHLAYGRSQFWDTMGLDIVIRAVEILKDRACPVVVHLVGRLPAEELARIERSSAKDCLVAHGYIPISRIEFFRSIHAGLTPYVDYEDLKYIFPIKVLEHLSQGNPVIASSIPGLCSMVQHEYNGLLVPPRDPEALAAAIERLQSDDLLFNRLSANALASIRRFDVVEKHRTIFEALSARLSA